MFVITVEKDSYYLLKVPVGMYTFPDGVLTRHEGSKSCAESTGGAVGRRPFNLFIVGFLGGTSGGRGALSNKQPVTIKILFVKLSVEVNKKCSPQNFPTNTK